VFFLLRNGVFLVIRIKVNPIDQWGKTLILVMGFAHGSRQWRSFSQNLF